MTLGTDLWANPVPRPTPASWWSARRATNSRWRRAVESCRPVVSRSSPPDSQGVGSSSSEMWTQRTGLSRLASPAMTRTSRSRSSSRTVSMSVGLDVHPLAGLLQHRPQHRLDLGELLRAGDERRRELDHGVAAVVGAADEAAAEELPREEAAQEGLGLLVREVLLGLLVLDQLDRVEVAGPPHVADDRDLAQRL